MGDTRSAFGFDQSERREDMAGLVRQLADQGTHLAEQQIALVKAEIRSGVEEIKQAAAAMAGAAVLGLAGVGVLLMGISFLMASVMPLWLATVIVAVIALGAGYAMYSTARDKMQKGSLNVDRTRRTIERAPDAIAGRPHERQNDVR